jgi:hypothetical protein
VTSGQCPSGEQCASFHCVGFCGMGGACVNGLTCCSPLCVNTATNPADCGACGNACGPYPHAVAGCAQSACTLGGCFLGFADCNGVTADGCETAINTDPANCGACGKACPPGDGCSGGTCVGPCGPTGCPGGEACCGALCANTQFDDNNCGGCGNICGAVPQGTTSCVSASCRITSCAPGFADCNGQVADGCEVDTLTDPGNCGFCGNGCGLGQTCVGGVCQMGSCGVTGCPVGQTCCNGGTTCIDTRSDVRNCGGCGNVCPPGFNVCQNGACCEFFDGGGVCMGVVCPGTEIDCGGVCVDPQSDPKNCGGCGIVCLAGSSCQKGQCLTTGNCGDGGVCAVGQACCVSGCTNIHFDPQNCGGCGQVCPPGDACTMGACTTGCGGGPVCPAGSQCCASGCTKTSSDPQNCGGCGIACAAGAACVNGQCTSTCNGGPACTGTQQCCATGCTDVTSDPQNCGGCSMPCAPADTCVMGVCQAQATCNGGPACSPNQTCCPGTGCADLSSDGNNCGMCGVACGPTQACVGGTCATSEGAFNPSVNPTFLPAGAHNYTSINIPAGVTVYVTGAGPASGTLQLSATGAIVIDGTIDVSGGPGTQNVITSSSTQSGRAGAGGFTGEPYQSAAASAACQWVAGNPGQLGLAIQGTSGTCPVASTTTCLTVANPVALLFAAPVAQFGGGAGVFTGYRAYGSGGGGLAGGAPGLLCAPYTVMGGEQDCGGVSGGGGAVNGQGGKAGIAVYDGQPGTSGSTQCPGISAGIPPACVGGGGGGSIGPASANDLAVFSTFQTGSAGGGGSADYLNRPVFGGTSGGGGGGGALRLSSPVSITVNGTLLANGGPGGDAFIGNGSNANCDPQPGAAGGGGSGGLIYLSAPTLNVNAGATISAVGGPGGAGSEFATGGAGGAGGLGRIRLSISGCSAFLNAFNPPLASCVPTGAKAGTTYVGTYPN